MTTDPVLVEQKDNIQFCEVVILKEAREENKLVKLLLYTGLSASTSDPLNLAVNAGTGEGKTYIIGKVFSLFSEDEVMPLAGMTEKALFHRSGTLVVKKHKEEDGEPYFESIEEQLQNLETSIAGKTSDLKNETNKDTIQTLRKEIKDLYSEKRKLMQDAKKLIDLSHKILIFLDTPNPNLFNTMMPLLSHDRFEVEYEYVDTHNGIKTKSNVLRGWPAVIFAQAIDYSKYQRWAEVQRRFIIANPALTQDKYRKAIDLIADKYGLPDFAYQVKVVSDDDKKRAKIIIRNLQTAIRDLDKQLIPGKNNIFNPFAECIRHALPQSQASDMTTAERFFKLMRVHTIIEFENRPRLYYRKKGSLGLNTIPMSTFEDLAEVLYVMEYANGVRPYVLEWFNNVFLALYQSKTEPDQKTKGTDEVVEEERIAVTTTQLVDKSLEVNRKQLSSKQILENYLDPLYNQNYIEKAESKLNRKANIYWPVLNVKSKKLFDSDQSNESLHCRTIPIIDSTQYPDREYVISRIKALLNQSSEEVVLTINNAKGEKSTALGIAECYYQNPEKYFDLRVVSDDNAAKPENSTSGSNGEENHSIGALSNGNEEIVNDV